MSLTISTELQTILDGAVRTVNNTCEIRFPKTGTLRFATAPLIIGGESFVNDLRVVGEIRRSIENPVDRVAVALQNVDRVLSQDLETNLAEWRLAEAILGRYYSGSGETEWIETFRGIVQQPVADDLLFRFDVIPDVLAKGPFIAARSLAALCPWKFKDPNTCGYSGSETSCNHQLRSKEGCSGLAWKHAFGGTEHEYNPDTSAPGTGGNDGGDIGGGCPRLDQWISTNAGEIRVRDLTLDHLLFNPVDRQFHRIKSLEIREADLVYIVSSNAAECYASDTHKVLWYREHVTGETITKFAEGDPVLCWTARGRELVDSKVSVLRFGVGRGEVMKIEMASGHIYCAGADPRRMIVAHNSKNPVDP